MAEQRQADDDDGHDALTEFVGEFLRRLDAGEAVELDAFVAAAPIEVRDELRARCLDVRMLRRVMPNAPAGSPARLASVGPGAQLGDFRLLLEIGRGAMGIVYLARQVSLQRLVAVKVLGPQLAQTERQVERFRREAKAAAKLHHPAIVPLYAVGESHGVQYFAMEYVDGRSLHAELENVRARKLAGGSAAAEESLGVRGGGSYCAQVADLVAQIADALEYAHKEGVIHRDVKPHNILIDSAGRPRLVDFGLAKDLNEISLSSTGDVAGTPYYMSPEQALARRIAIDHRTDVFSLGVVLYEMLTLRRPFEGKTSQQVLYKISFLDPEPIRRSNREVPRDLETICFRAVEKSPGRRYATAGEFAADLRRFLAHEAIVARAPTLFERGMRKLARNRTLAAAAVAALLVCSSFALWRNEVEAGRAIEQRFARLSDIEHASDLTHVPFERLAAAAAELSSLRGALGRSNPRDSARLDAMLARVRDRGLALRESGLELMRRSQPERVLDADSAIASGDSPPTASISFWLTRGTTDLEQASALLPEDRELAALVSKFRAGAQLSVTSDVDGALVRIYNIGALNGQRIGGSELGRTPLRDVNIAPGCYRITVDAGELGFAEMTRTIPRPNTRFDLHARIARTPAVTSDMVAIAAGPFVFGDPTNTNVFKQREARVDAFWIDATEVSNAQYRAFVLDTGHALPALWLDRDGRDVYRSEWGELPIAGVRWSDAVGYAEWAGKRLPTQFEWERAARGTAGRRFAWSDDGGEVLLRTNLGRPKCWDAADFFRDASPVGSHANGCSPEGVFHLFDNVREWTESPYGKLVDGAVEVQSGTFIVMGGDWGSNPATWDLRFRASSYFDNYEFALGFRCAKSSAP